MTPDVRSVFRAEHIKLWRRPFERYTAAVLCTLAVVTPVAMVPLARHVGDGWREYYEFPNGLRPVAIVLQQVLVPIGVLAGAASLAHELTLGTCALFLTQQRQRWLVAAAKMASIIEYWVVVITLGSVGWLASACMSGRLLLQRSVEIGSVADGVGAMLALILTGITSGFAGFAAAALFRSLAGATAIAIAAQMVLPAAGAGWAPLSAYAHVLNIESWISSGTPALPLSSGIGASIWALVFQTAIALAVTSATLINNWHENR